MLSLVALWAVSGLVFFAIGAPILNVTGAQACLTRTGDRIFVSIWLGIVVLANLLLFASLFFQLTINMVALVVMVSLTQPFLRRSKLVIADISINRKTAWALLAITLVSAYLLQFATDALEDTGAYHHQMVNWLSEYGSVPGLALINDRFGFTSSWFALIAPLQTGIFRNRLIMGMNNFIFVLTILQTYVLLGRALENRAGIDDWFFIFAFALFSHYYFPDFIYSPSPDLPASLMVLVVTWLVIAISLSNRLENNGSPRWAWVVVLILASGAVSFKLSSIPLLAVVMFYYLFAQGFSLHKIYMATAIITSFAAILICVSTVTSGCPLYPAPYFCTDLPWSLGSENARAISSSIFEFAKWVGPAPSDATSLNWIWRTPTNVNIFNDKPLMKWLLLVNILCAVWLYLRRDQVGKKVVMYVALSALAGIFFILVKAPHLRFGLSFFLIIPALACASFLPLIQKCVINKVGYNKLCLLLATYFMFASIAPHYIDKFLRLDSRVDINWSYVYNATQMFIFLPRPMLPIGLVHTWLTAQGNNFQYIYAEDGLCWGAEIPCASGKIGVDVWLRDEKTGFGKGFAHAPL